MKHLPSILIAFILFNLSCTEERPLTDKFITDFENTETGKLSDNETKRIWPDATILCGKKDFLFYKLGITPVPHSISNDGSNHFLKVLIPKKHFGPIVGAQWKIPIQPSDEYYFSYQVKFENSFDFVKGGKLPGLAGGTANSGGNIPNGYDGWSARMMFWDNGKLSLYVYYPNQSTKWGERLYLKNIQGDTVRISHQAWHTITQRVKMNTPGKANGILQAWYDGDEAFFSDSIVFRNDENLRIDQIFYSVFLGGDDLSWTSSKDEYICFDNFTISPQMINN